MSDQSHILPERFEAVCFCDGRVRFTPEVEGSMVRSGATILRAGLGALTHKRLPWPVECDVECRG